MKKKYFLILILGGIVLSLSPWSLLDGKPDGRQNVLLFAGMPGSGSRVSTSPKQMQRGNTGQNGDTVYKVLKGVFDGNMFSAREEILCGEFSGREAQLAVRTGSEQTRITLNGKSSPYFKTYYSAPSTVTLEHGGIAAAARYDKQQHHQIYFSLPLLKAEHIRFLAQKAGCHFFAPTNCTVYADNRFIGIFPKETIKCITYLKEKRNVFDVISGRFIGNKSEIPLQMNEKSAAFFVLT